LPTNDIFTNASTFLRNKTKLFFRVYPDSDAVIKRIQEAVSDGRCTVEADPEKGHSFKVTAMPGVNHIKLK